MARTKQGVAAVIVAVMVASLAVRAHAEPFRVGLRDGSSVRCGSLHFNEVAKLWTLRGCEPIARLFAQSPPPTPVPTATAAPQCPGCLVWDPVTDTTSCQPC